MDAWVHYLAANPDLMRQGLLSRNDAEHHFLTLGGKEGRPTRFRWQHYLAANPSLWTAGYKNEKQALQHYFMRGFRENRPTVFKWEPYLAANPDLQAAGLTTEAQALQHYLTHGIAEKRETAFKWEHYLAANPDLAVKTAAAATDHYLKYGFRENRPTVFDWQTYLAANPDLIEAGLLAEEKAVQHYVTFGIAETRLTVFDWQNYLKANPDLPFQSKEEALQHYIYSGCAEGRRSFPKLDLRHPALTVVFVAHTMEIVLQLNRDYVQPHILFVGSKPFYGTENPNVVVVRDLPHHIEDKWRLLTFTAWYAVAKNDLYLDSERLCLLEYDARIVADTFCEQVVAQTADLVGFVADRTNFFKDIRPEILSNFLKIKGIDPARYGSDFEWLCTTNLCAKRAFFVDFVKWYDYAYLMKKDDKNLPFYHERLVAVYAKNVGCSTHLVPQVLHHAQNNSHSTKNPVLVLYEDGSAKPALARLVQSVRAHSPAVRVAYVQKKEMKKEFVAAHARILETPRGGGLWLWKPYSVLFMLEAVNDGDTIVYLDSKYVFVAPVEKLLVKGDFLVWKNKPGEPAYSHVKYCKQSVLAKYASGECEQAWAGLLVIRKTAQTLAMVREWLAMCCSYEDISDEFTGPNHAGFVDHRHDQSLLTIVLAKHGVPLLALDTSILIKQV